MCCLLAVILLPSCNKQNDEVGEDDILIENGKIRISSSCADDSKNVFYLKAWRFLATDVAWVNGTRLSTFPYNKGRMAHVWADTASDNIYKALYPADAYTSTISDIDAPTVYLYPRVSALPRIIADTINPLNANDHRVLPMTAYLENPSRSSRFHFYNTMCLIGPNFLYGIDFGEELMDHVGTNQYQIPNIIIDSISIVAQDGQPLWGDGVISNPYTTNPEVVLNQVTGHQQVTYVGLFEELVVNTSPTREALPNSYLPIIPCYGYFTMNIYFHCTFTDIGTCRFRYSKTSTYPQCFARSTLLNTNILMDSQSDFNNYVTVL